MMKLVRIWTIEIGEMTIGQFFFIVATNVYYTTGPRNAFCTATY
jgi:hypothetical protein